MIYFALPEESFWGMQNYLGGEWGGAQADRISLRSYEQMFRGAAAPRGTWIFTGIDQLTPAGVEIATLFSERLKQEGCRLLNDPRKVLLRFDLLRTLTGKGFNRFRAIRTTEPRSSIRFPVFLREENGHGGDLCGLIDSPERLEKALVQIVVRGFQLSELLIVEFCDTSDASGAFRKYSAFIVGDRVIPRNLQVSRQWMIKHHQRLFDEECAAEEIGYIQSHPHAGWLPDIFRLANIEYGRIDYGMLGDSPQIWEINTLPTIGRGPGTGERPPEWERFRKLIRPAAASFHTRFGAAFEAIDDVPGNGEPIQFRAPPKLLRLWASEVASQKRLRDRRALLARLSGNPVVRAVRPVLEPGLHGVIRLLGR